MEPDEGLFNVEPPSTPTTPTGAPHPLVRWAAALAVAGVVALYIVLNWDAVARPLAAILKALAGTP